MKALLWKLYHCSVTTQNKQKLIKINNHRCITDFDFLAVLRRKCFQLENLNILNRQLLLVWRSSFSMLEKVIILPTASKNHELWNGFIPSSWGWMFHTSFSVKSITYLWKRSSSLDSSLEPLDAKSMEGNETWRGSLIFTNNLLLKWQLTVYCTNSALHKLSVHKKEITLLTR